MRWKMMNTNPTEAEEPAHLERTTTEGRETCRREPSNHHLNPSLALCPVSRHVPRLEDHASTTLTRLNALVACTQVSSLYTVYENTSLPESFVPAKTVFQNQVDVNGLRVFIPADFFPGDVLPDFDDSKGKVVG